MKIEEILEDQVVLNFNEQTRFADESSYSINIPVMIAIDNIKKTIVYSSSPIVLITTIIEIIVIGDDTVLYKCVDKESNMDVTFTIFEDTCLLGSKKDGILLTDLNK